MKSMATLFIPFRSRRLSIEIQPPLGFVVVKLANSQDTQPCAGVKPPFDGILRISRDDGPLRGRQAIERNAGAYVVCRVFQDMQQNRPYGSRKNHMNRTPHLYRENRPLGFVVEPNHTRMGMVQMDHEPHQPMPYRLG